VACVIGFVVWQREVALVPEAGEDRLTSADRDRVELEPIFVDQPMTIERLGISPDCCIEECLFGWGDGGGVVGKVMVPRHI
jgi:hypothetical protein